MEIALTLLEDVSCGKKHIFISAKKSQQINKVESIIYI